MFAHIPVDIQAMLRNCAELEPDLALQLEISFYRDLLQTRLYVDQPSDDAALRVRDLDRVVGCQK